MIKINTSFIKWHYIYNRDRTFTIMIILLLLIRIIVIDLISFILLFKSFIFQNIKCYIFIFTHFYFTSRGWSWDKLNQYLKKKHSAVLPYLIRSSTAGFIKLPTVCCCHTVIQHEPLIFTSEASFSNKLASPLHVGWPLVPIGICGGWRWTNRCKRH